MHAAPWPLARVGTESRAFGPHSLMNTALEGWSCGLAPRKAACRVLEPEKTVPHAAVKSVGEGASARWAASATLAAVQQSWERDPLRLTRTGDIRFRFVGFKPHVEFR